jgi:hypothetical protein
LLKANLISSLRARNRKGLSRKGRILPKTMDSKENMILRKCKHFYPLLYQYRVKIQRFIRAKLTKKRSFKSQKLQFSDKKKRPPQFERFNLAVEFKREDFILDFSAALSDRSTTDNFISDDDPKMNSRKKSLKQLTSLPLELE